ncbi:MAG: cobalt ECF transporter T component CbiQ [Anaerolineaceae bacterium]
MKSPIHSLDGRAKLVFIVAIILSCTLLPTSAWPAYILIFSILVALILLSDLNLAYVMKRSLLVLPFLLTAFPLIFRASESSIITYTVDKITITISQEGLIRFVSLGIKSWLSVIAAILLASTTSFTELLLAMRSLKIPRLLVAVFGLMWRYLFLMFEEVERLIRARKSRSGRDPSFPTRLGRSLKWQAGVTGGMAGSVFLRSLERSERVYNSMLARGYDGEIRSLEEPPIQSGVLLWLIIAVAGLFVLVLVTNLLMGAL